MVKINRNNWDDEESKSSVSKLKSIGIIVGIISILMILIPTVMTLDYDQAIINYGVSLVSLLKTVRLIGITLIIVSIGLFTIPTYLDSRKQATEAKIKVKEKETNPYYEEPIIINKLRNSIGETDNGYIQYGKKMIRQLNLLNDQIDDYKSVTSEYDYPIIESIDKELMTAKLKFIENAKSINNRLLISNGQDEIVKRLDENDETLNQVKALVLEAINYVDEKTPRTDSNLNNLTESLQELIKTINN